MMIELNILMNFSLLNDANKKIKNISLCQKK